MNFKDSVTLYKVWDLDEALVPEHQMISDKEHNKYIQEQEQHYTDQLNAQEELHTMANLKETASAYEAPQTLNIADLEVVSTDLDVQEKTGTNKDGDDFTYNYVEVEGKQYRVPNSVLTELKTILEEKPDLQKFRVKKTGQGLQTRYTVVPLI